MTTPSDKAPAASTALAAPFAGACLAVAIPSLLAFNLPPSATFLNQAAALVGWGGWLMILAAAMPTTRWSEASRPSPPAVLAALAALALLALAALVSPAWSGLTSTLSLSSAGLIATAALVMGTATTAQHWGSGSSAWTAFCIALVAAGALSTLIGILQVFAPEWTGGNWIAATAVEGRAVGNLRQPNHLATLLLWSIVAAVWLGSSGRWPRPVSIGLSVLMLFGLVLTASRTGMIGVAMLALWGVVDRRLPKPSRSLLWLMPVLYVLCWVTLTNGSAAGEATTFHGESQLHRSDISSSRFGIWANTLSLIAAHPWFGVGFGEFNFAWSLTPFPNRPTAFFDHTHNLPLQLAVELGLPLATLVLSLLAYALWSAFKAARDAVDERDAHLRPAFVMVLMIAVHSQLEYPLWYAYFLLPTAFAWGLCLGAPAKDDAASSAAASPASPSPRKTRPLLIGAMLLMIGGIYSVIDYWKVVVIFAPPEGAPPLSQRILDGRRSVFFGHHADYAAATSVPEPGNVMPAFQTATHYLLDTRLMLAWAQALAAHGDLDRARHIAARLREFHNPASDEFFEPCDRKGSDAPSPPPFQCQPPTKLMDYRDFR